jgi:hypothetical protein
VPEGRVLRAQAWPVALATEESFDVAAGRAFGRIPVLLVRMNSDLLTGEEIKKTGDEDARTTLFQTSSLPFSRPSTGRIAVKVINHYGDEVVKVYEV